VFTCRLTENDDTVPSHGSYIYIYSLYIYIYIYIDSVVGSNCFQRGNGLTSRKNEIVNFLRILLLSFLSDHLETMSASVVRVPGYRSRGLGSIPRATRCSEKEWVWNGVHSAS
jgi:hypothetical protein